MGIGARAWMGTGAGYMCYQRVTQTSASAALPPAVPSSCGAGTLRLHGVCEPPTFVDATPPPTATLQETVQVTAFAAVAATPPVVFALVVAGLTAYVDVLRTSAMMSVTRRLTPTGAARTGPGRTTDRTPPRLPPRLSTPPTIISALVRSTRTSSTGKGEEREGGAWGRTRMDGMRERRWPRKESTSRRVICEPIQRGLARLPGRGRQ
jgi:hypothetical protein